jgi:hypothetical protein
MAEVTVTCQVTCFIRYTSPAEIAQIPVCNPCLPITSRYLPGSLLTSVCPDEGYPASIFPCQSAEMLNKMTSPRFSRRFAHNLLGRCLTALMGFLIVSSLSGCSEGGLGGGGGTVDLAKAKEAAASNPEIAKAAANRGAAPVKDAQSKGKR